MMSIDGKAFTIQCVNRNKEIINLRMKNMPDFDEMGNIIQIGKKIQSMYCILLGFLFALVFTFIISYMWFVRLPEKSDLECAYMLILLLAYGSYCISVNTIGKTLKRRFVIRGGCDYIWRYMETYNDERWNKLLSTIEGYRVLLDVDFHQSTIDTNVDISFGRKCFTLYLPDRMCEIFWLEVIVRDPTLNKDTVEFDFLRSELKVPMNFDYDH